MVKIHAAIIKTKHIFLQSVEIGERENILILKNVIFT